VAREPTGRPSGSQSRTAGDAFATVAIQSIRNLIVRADVVNVNSGAIAIDVMKGRGLPLLVVPGDARAAMFHLGGRPL
jgi:hypothetical protein